jgi:hypothetical protein
MNIGEPVKITQHAMLVIWGQFAQSLGLPQELDEVKLGQKTVIHSPQTKILEFFVAILGGLAHLKDISRSAHPLDQDQEVARAWGQAGWADYSGVSRTLSGMSMDEAKQIVQVLDDLSRPIIEREILLTQQSEGKIIYDCDLTGRPVSSNSSSYPGAAYGYMGDGLHLGYQAAMVSMHSPTYGRLWLSVEPHPGNTVSCTELEGMVEAAEQKTGMRPWRRTDLLQQRIDDMKRQHEILLAQVQETDQALVKAKAERRETEEGLQQRRQILAKYEAEYEEKQRVERPYSRLAQARRRVATYQRRLARREQAVAQAETRLLRCQTRADDAHADIERLRNRLAQFEQDNATNPAPIMAEFRLDAGFGTRENVAWLIEMGYEVYTKPHNGWLKSRLERRLNDQTVWTRVGQNAEMTAWSAVNLDDFPYPLDLAFERFHTNDGLRESVLIHFGSTPVTENLASWFQHYNQRQTIEAGIKEGKQVFQMHHLKVRAEAALYLQEHFATFAANFVRWAALWLLQQQTSLPNTWQNPADLPVKERSFEVQREWVYQLPLPIPKSYLFSSV